jgi:DNA-binding NarL/FixJ family response regulator
MAASNMIPFWEAVSVLSRLGMPPGRRPTVKSVLVCLHGPVAEQAVSHAAAQLGLGEVVTTVVGGSAALARVERQPADVVLVDTAAVRPDTVAFTRRVLERSPGATVLFFGPEESTVARGAVAAGARGLIRGGEREDLVVSVAKGLMLLLRGPRRVEAAGTERAANGRGGQSAAASQARPTEDGGPAVPLPLQRSEAEEAADGPDTDEGAEPDESVAAANGREMLDGAVAGVGTPGTATVEGVRRLALTERELQVLRGMADGKSNAEIGRELFVSEDTVKTHARRLFRKLGARDRAHAVAAAFRAGLVR